MGERTSFGSIPSLVALDHGVVLEDTLLPQFGRGGFAVDAELGHET